MITKKDRTRIIWASFALIIFLILLFVAIVVFGLKFEGLIGGQIVFMANVAVAISSAVIASSLTGFLDIIIERNFGEKGKFAVRAAGGFAVFLVVMWMSPSNQMRSLEQSLFAQASQRCSAAVEGNSGADGKTLCENLVDQYPDRPEPRRLLARYWHQRAVSISDFEIARDGYQEALSILGFDPVSGELQRKIQDDHLYPELWENMRRYAASHADLALARFEGNPQDNLLESDLHHSLRVLRSFKKNYLDVAGEDEVIIYATLEGRVLFYLSQVAPANQKKQLLQDSFIAFNYVHPRGRQYFQRSLEALLVLAVLHGSQQQGDDFVEDIELIFSSLHVSWDRLLNTRRSSGNAPFFRDHVKKLVDNSRKEKYRVTLLIGSERYGGAEAARLFQDYAAKLPWLSREFSIG